MDAFHDMICKLMQHNSSETLKEAMDLGEQFIDDPATIENPIHAVVGLLVCSVGMELQKRGEI